VLHLRLSDRIARTLMAMRLALRVCAPVNRAVARKAPCSFPGGRSIHSHVVNGAPFPQVNPVGLEEGDECVRFDPKLHLQLEAPTYTVLLKTNVSEEDEPFAVSASFRVLSDKGVAAVRDVIAANMKYAKSTERNPLLLRGLNYRSRFMRDLTYSPEVSPLEIVSPARGTHSGARLTGCSPRARIRRFSTTSPPWPTPPSGPMTCTLRPHTPLTLALPPPQLRTTWPVARC
jgi:hypothetical protein